MSTLNIHLYSCGCCCCRPPPYNGMLEGSDTPFLPFWLRVTRSIETAASHLYGVVHKSVTLSYVSILVQLNQCIVFGSVLHMEHSGDGCLGAPNGYSLRVVGVPQLRGTVQIVSTLSCLSGGPCLRDPAVWLARRQLLAEESNPGPTPTLKTLLHTLTKYTNSPVQPSLSSSLSPGHLTPNSPTSVQSPLQNTPTYRRASIQLQTLIYLKQHTGPLDVSREGGASANQVERTPSRATLTSWVVGPLHSYTQEAWVDNNNMGVSGLE